MNINGKFPQISGWQTGFLWRLRPFALARPSTHSDFPGPGLAMTQSSTADMFTEGGNIHGKGENPTNI